MKCDWCPPTCYNEFPACFQLYPGKSDNNNPGNIQELHALAHRIMPKFLDGIELDYVHRLATNKFITCNWVLSHTRPSGFRLGGIYTLRHQNEFLLTPTIQADINPTTLSSNVAFLYYPFKPLRLQVNMQRAAEDVPLMTQCTLEYQGRFNTITGNLYNARQDSGRATVSLMHSMTDHLAVGAEALFEWMEPQSTMIDLAFAGRYSHYNQSIATTFSRQGLDISFWQRVHEKIQMASFLAWHRKTQKTIGTICYQWDFDDALVRGMFDSDMSVGFMYQRTLSHIPCAVAMSLLISLPTNRFVYGLKFSLDPSGYRRGE